MKTFVVEKAKILVRQSEANSSIFEPECCYIHFFGFVQEVSRQAACEKLGLVNPGINYRPLDWWYFPKRNLTESIKAILNGVGTNGFRLSELSELTEAF